MFLGLQSLFPVCFLIEGGLRFPPLEMSPPRLPARQTWWIILLLRGSCPQTGPAFASVFLSSPELPKQQNEWKSDRKPLLGCDPETRRGSWSLLKFILLFGDPCGGFRRAPCTPRSPVLQQVWQSQSLSPQAVMQSLPLPHCCAHLHPHKLSQRAWKPLPYLNDVLIRFPPRPRAAWCPEDSGFPWDPRVSYQYGKYFLGSSAVLECLGHHRHQQILNLVKEEMAQDPRPTLDTGRSELVGLLYWPIC